MKWRIRTHPFHSERGSFLKRLCVQAGGGGDGRQSGPLSSVHPERGLWLCLLEDLWQTSWKDLKPALKSLADGGL